MRHKLTKAICKEAGLGSEIAGSALWAPLILPDIIGGYLAHDSNVRSRKEQINAENQKFTNLIPGLGAYNLAKRLQYTTKVPHYKKIVRKGSNGVPYEEDIKDNSTLDDELGMRSALYNTGLLGFTGGALGGIISKLVGKSVAKGIKYGALTGVSAGLSSQVLGIVLGIIRKKRTPREQRLLNNPSRINKRIITPGLTAYDFVARLKGSLNDTKDYNFKKSLGTTLTNTV